MAVIGDVYLQLGLYADATAQLEAALATRGRIGKGEDAKAAELLQALSVVKKVAGDYEAADTLAGEVSCCSGGSVDRRPISRAA